MRAWYRVGFPPSPALFELEIDGIDLRAMVAAYREQAARRTRPPGVA